MRIKYILLFIILLCQLPPTVNVKTAVIVYPYDNDTRRWTQELTNIIIDQLIQKSYRIIIFTSSNDVKHVYAYQIVFVFVGHSNPNDRDNMWAEWGLISTSFVLKHIHTYQLIMLTSTCGGGQWLEYAKNRRLIISAVNETKGIIEVYYENGILVTPTPTIATLLKLSYNTSIEEGYVLWEQQLLSYYNQEEWGGHYSNLYPVIYDGIKGEIWL